AFALEEVGNGVEADAVDAHAEPTIQHFHHRVTYRRIVEVEVGLMAVEAVPEIRAGDGIPAPIRGFKILKDDAGFLISFRRIAPHVPIAQWRARRSAAR